jgi:hypothetical protein
LIAEELISRSTKNGNMVEPARHERAADGLPRLRDPQQQQAWQHAQIDKLFPRDEDRDAEIARPVHRRGA